MTYNKDELKKWWIDELKRWITKMNYKEVWIMKKEVCKRSMKEVWKKMNYKEVQRWIKKRIHI